MKKFGIFCCSFLIFGLLATFSNFALAQDPPPSGPNPGQIGLPIESLTLSDDDLTKRVVFDQLFGPLLGIENGNSMGPAIFIFNSFMLFVGGILLAYTLIAGTINTAHDGEMLGKRWSATWLPIRTVAGAAAVAPVMPGGFCVAQAIVLWLAMQGVALANQVWVAFTTDPLEGAFMRRLQINKK
jgi:hypothetical protein